MESLFPLPDAERIFSTLLRTAECTNLARLAVEYAVKEAAESKTSFEFDLNFQAEPGVDFRQVITPGQQLWFLYCENILCCIIYYQRNALGIRWFYRGQDFGEANVNACRVLPNGMIEITHAIPDPQGPFQAHGPVLFASEGIKGECMLYADGVPYAGAAVGALATVWSLTFVNAFPVGSPATMGFVALGRYNNEDPTNDGFVTTAGANLTPQGNVPIVTAPVGTATQWVQTISDDVYLQIVADNTGAVPPPSVLTGGVLLTVTGTCSVWSHYPCADVWASITTYANGETLFLANNLTLWNPNRNVPMSAMVYGNKLLNSTDDVSIMRYAKGGDASQLMTQLGPPQSRDECTWTHGIHVSLLPADTSWQNYAEVLTAASNNASSGIYDAKYRRQGSGLNGVLRAQVKVICLNVQGITNATVLEGMTVHSRVVSAWMYTSSRQSPDQRIPTIFPDVWTRCMCIAQAGNPIFEVLDPNRQVKPLSALMAEMITRWRQCSSNNGARIAGQGIPQGMSAPESGRLKTQQDLAILKRQNEQEAASALEPLKRLKAIIKLEK